ncbi:hypothetical protein CsSME_00001978 [Camellia sinensis var. sinensis]
MSVSPCFSRRRCTSAVEEIIRTEIRKVETEYSRYTREQKRAYHRPPTPAESYASCYQEPCNNQPMNMEQSPEQQGPNPAYPIEVSSGHNPPSPMYTPRSPDQATDSADEDPEEDFDWSGNEN